MSQVKLEAITKRYGDFRALDNIDLEIKEGEFLTLLGASGSGKTTCLRTIAGFVKPDSGRLFIGIDEATSIPPYRRDIGMVFQHYALFPHMTVAQNVAYGLKVRRVARAETQKRTREALELVHLAELANRFPRQLSGGQKQRVALARAVVVRPRVLLLDEPLGALDLKLREELQTEIRRVQQALGITTLSVTHDQNEALSMSDRVVVMANGRILQVDTPSALYRRPISAYVAKFVGRMNLLRARVLRRDAPGERYLLALDTPEQERIECVGPQSAAFEPGDVCLVGFRPEDAQPSAGSPNRIRVNVEKTTYLGAAWLLSCTHPHHGPISLTATSSASIPSVGSTIDVSWDAGSCLILKPEGERAEPLPKNLPTASEQLISQPTGPASRTVEQPA